MIVYLDKPKSAIQGRASQLGVKRFTVKVDEEYIFDHYNGYNLHELAEKLGASVSKTYEYIKKLKIHQTKIPITAEIKRKRLEVVKAMHEGKTKTCAKCGMESDNPVRDFVTQYKENDGLRSECKICSTNRNHKNEALRHLNEQVRKEKQWKKSIEKQFFLCKGCGGEFKGGDMNTIMTRFYVSPWCKSCYNKQKKEQSIELMMKKARGEV